MTGPKTPEKAAAAKPSAAARDAGRTSGSDDIGARIVDAINRLGERLGGAEGGTTTPSEVPVEQRRVVFAYEFLGEVLGRRGLTAFQLRRVVVERGLGTLTFRNLEGATVARVRAANNVVRVLEGLSDGTEVTVDEGPNAIANDQRIDSIVVFESLGGAPVALGPCLGPVSDVD